MKIPSHSDPRGSVPRQPVIQPGGWPWLDIALSPDPKTGEMREARGVIAIGTRALGVIAFGGLARGIIAIGGMAVGILSFGGISVGGLALGGLALGYHAMGGGAAGYSAQGGGAIGRYACGGAAWGEYVLSPAQLFDDTGPTSEALEFFGRYGNPGCRAMVSTYAAMERSMGMPPAQFGEHLRGQLRDARALQQDTLDEAQAEREQAMREAKAQLDEALQQSRLAIEQARRQHRESMEALQQRNAAQLPPPVPAPQASETPSTPTTADP